MRLLAPPALLRAACAAFALLISAPASAAGLPHFGGILIPGADPLPRIDNVQFAGGPSGVSATINGNNFGAAPADVPCTACTPLELQVLDVTADGTEQAINVVAWSNTQITVTGIAANAGDAMEIDAYNDTTGNAGAWGGLVSREKGLPKITSIQVSGSGETLSLTVNGTGFGAAPPGIGPNVNTPFFMFSDINNASTGTGGGRWNAGYCGAYECDGVTLNYASWSNTQIVMSGFGGQYANGSWYVNPRDAFCVAVWPSTGQSDGTTGGVAKCGRLPK
jgi:hypothetical protein